MVVSKSLFLQSTCVILLYRQTNKQKVIHFRKEKQERAQTVLLYLRSRKEVTGWVGQADN